MALIDLDSDETTLVDLDTPEPSTASKIAEIPAGVHAKLQEGAGGLAAGLGTFLQAPAANTLAGLANVRAFIQRHSQSDRPSEADAEILRRTEETARRASGFAAEQREENFGSVLGAPGGMLEMGGRETAARARQEFETAAPNMAAATRSYEEAEGALGTAEAIAKNPYGLIGILAQSAPDMAMGMGAGSVAYGIARRAGARAALAKGATEEAADVLGKAAGARAAAFTTTASEASSAALQGREGVHQFVTDLPFERKLASPRFLQLLRETGDPAEASAVLANELADQVPMLVAAGTAAGTALTSRLFGGNATVKSLTEQGRITLRELGKRVAADTVEEVMQGVPEDYLQYSAQSQADPSLAFDPGKAAVMNAAAGFGMGAPGHTVAYAAGRRAKAPVTPDPSITTSPDVDTAIATSVRSVLSVDAGDLAAQEVLAATANAASADLDALTQEAEASLAALAPPPSAPARDVGPAPIIGVEAEAPSPVALDVPAPQPTPAVYDLVDTLLERPAAERERRISEMSPTAQAAIRYAIAEQERTAAALAPEFVLPDQQTSPGQGQAEIETRAALEAGSVAQPAAVEAARGLTVGIRGTTPKRTGLGDPYPQVEVPSVEARAEQAIAAQRTGTAAEQAQARTLEVSQQEAPGAALEGAPGVVRRPLPLNFQGMSQTELQARTKSRDKTVATAAKAELERRQVLSQEAVAAEDLAARSSLPRGISPEGVATADDIATLEGPRGSGTIEGRPAADYSDTELLDLAQRARGATRNAVSHEIVTRGLTQPSAAPAPAPTGPQRPSTPGGSSGARVAPGATLPEHIPQGPGTVAAEITRELSRAERGSGTTWSAQVVMPETGAGAAVGAKEAKVVRVLAKLFKKNVVFYQASRSDVVRDAAGKPTLDAEGKPVRRTGMTRMGGFVGSRGDTIYINVHSPESGLTVVLHELVHLMERDHPEIYSALVRAVVADLQKSGKGKDAVALYQRSGYLGPEIIGEMVADVMGNQARDPKFWSNVFTRVAMTEGKTKAQQLILKLRQAVVKMIAAVRAQIQGRRDFENIITDLEAVGAAMEEAAAKYFIAQQDAARAEAGEVRESKSRPLKREDPMEISPRRPTGVKSEENGVQDLLQIDADAIYRNPEGLRQQMSLIQTYPNYREADGANTPKQKAERFINHVKSNLLWLYEQVPQEIRDRSHLWYDGANKIARRLANEYGIAPAQAAGVLAALSPQKDWFTNVSLGERVIDIALRQNDKPWTKEMSVTAERIYAKEQYAPIVAAIEGKSMNDVEGLLEKAAWLRAYDETHNSRHFAIINPEGTTGPQKRNFPSKANPNGALSVAAWGSMSTIAKSLSILENGSLRNVDAQLGDQHKVRSFYNNILVPNSKNGHVTIDTHAVAAGLLRPLSGNSREVFHNFGSGVLGEPGPGGSKIIGYSGTYGLYAEAYRRAAKEVGILPREMQSITWEAVRGLFERENKKTMDFDPIWAKFKKGRASLENTQQAILEAADGIRDPDWYRPGDRSAAEVRDAGDQSELDRAGVAGQEGAPTDRRGTRRSAERALLNVGLDIPNSDEKLSEQEVRDAIEARGGKILRIVQHQSKSELTAVVALEAPLTDAAMDGLSRDLKQEAIPQSTDGGRTGKLYGPMAAKWGPFNPEYFYLMDGRTAAETHGAQQSRERPQTETPEFKRWFGDWQDPKAFTSRYPADKTPVSQAVNDDGSPMRMYHATNADFAEFETGRESVTSTTFGAFPTRRHAIFATPDVGFAEEYLRRGGGQNVMPVYLDIKAPIDLRGNKGWDYVDELAAAGFPNTRWPNMPDTQMWELLDDETGEAFVAAAKKAGYDGVIMYEVDQNDRMVEVWAAFEPTQIKSAIGNQGTFDPADPDIRRSTERPDAVSATGYHFSKQQRGTLDASYSGTGTAGAERARLSDRTKKRINFYVGTGGPITPEDGVGAHAHKVALSNLYDKDADPRQLNRMPATEFEEAVMDAGYDGYLTRDFGGRGAAVLLGDRSVPVDEYLGTPARIENPEQVAAPKVDDEQAATRAFLANKTYPSGMLTGEEWGRLVKALDPAMHERLAPTGVFEKTDRMYKDELVKESGVRRSAERRPAVVDSLDLRGDGRDFTEFFSEASAGNRAPDVKEYFPVIDISAVKDFSREYVKHRGNFDDHIASSIPGFREVQQAVGDAVVKTYGSKPSHLLDIGASEGAFGKTITKRSNGQIRTLSLDPNLKMAEHFRTHSSVPGATYETSAFGSKADEGALAWTEDDGTEIKTFAPPRKYDVIHEAMVFQFISNARNAQLARIKEMLKPDGLVLIEEKIFEDTDQFRANEAQKDAYKARYFTPAALEAKRKEVLERGAAAVEKDEAAAERKTVGMNELMTTADELDYVLAKNFGTVVQYWDSGNFKGYAASDNPETVQTFLDNLVDLNTEFSTVETPRPVQMSVERWYHSQLARAVEQASPKVFTTGPQVKAWLTSSQAKLGIKRDELEWTGVLDWLNTQKKLTKDDVLAYLQAGGVKVEEVTLGHNPQRLKKYRELLEQSDAAYLLGDVSEGDRLGVEAANAFEPEQEPPVFSRYQLPGGENYRELLLTLPERNDASGWTVVQHPSGDGFAIRAENGIYGLNPNGIGERKWATRSAAKDGIADYAETQERFDFKSPHFDQPNILAHVRFNERTDADGKRVLFIEEIQSDWGQSGKKQGFATKKPAVYEWFSKDGQRHREEFATDKEAYAYMETISQRPDFDGGGMDLSKVVGAPRAPFVTDTKAWTGLALKRMIAFAAENGFDRIAWTNGEQQAARYDLSKQIDEITHVPNGNDTWQVQALKGDRVVWEDFDASVSTLEDHLGKEIAQKIADGEGEAVRGMGFMKSLSGLDLKVGGEGMKAFYDQIVPQVANDVLRKIGGGKVGVVPLGIRKGVDIQSRQMSRGSLQAVEAERMYGDSFASLSADEKAAVNRKVDELLRNDGTPQPGFDVPEIPGGTLPLFSRPRFPQGQPSATFASPTESKLDDLIYKLQDKHVDMKRVFEAIGNVADKWNAYLQEELFHGRAAKKTQDFLTDELRPLLEDMKARGVEMSDFEEYLWNRHAEERNQQIAGINPQMPDGGSGINTADARAYLAGLPADKLQAYQALAARVDAITQGTRQELVGYGLETQQTVRQWANTYQNYVPLQREDMDEGGSGMGQGFSTRGAASRRAMGSGKPVVDILANLVLQRERAITRGEKNRVATALYGAAIQNPNTDFWAAIRPGDDPATVAANLVQMGLNPIDAQNAAQSPTQRYVDPRTGLVAERVNPAYTQRNNVIAARVNGEDRFVVFNTRDERAMRMAESLKNIDVAALEGLFGTVAKVTRYFASINTQYNPIFGIVNLFRDVQAGMINLSSTAIRGRKREVLGHVPSALAGIYADLRAIRSGQQPTSVWANLWEEFQNEGGQTGYRDMYANAEDRADALVKALKDLGKPRAARLLQLSENNPIFGWLSDYNTTMENAVRLAAYKVAKEQGRSNAQAASIAKNLTVNFNRKGQVSRQAGALYAFFNAAVQGTARIGETMFEFKGGQKDWKNVRLSSTGKKVVAGGVLLGALQAMFYAMAGFDDDNPPGFVRERALVIPIGDKKFITLPLPLGYHAIFNLGRIPTEYVLGGFRKGNKRIVEMFSILTEAFNPMGSAGVSMQTVAPTILDPLAALIENKDWTGKPIAKQDRSNLESTPGHTRAKDTASWVGKFLSEGINYVSGGNKYVPGIISPTQDQIDYLIGQGTGGVGRELLKAQSTASSMVTGEDLPPHKIPLVGRFYGEAKGQAAEGGSFYENLKTINTHEAAIKAMIKDGKSPAEYIRANPDARLVETANQAERQVQNLRKMKRQMVERNAPRERVRQIEDQITRTMARLNAQVRKVEQSGSRR